MSKIDIVLEKFGEVLSKRTEASKFLTDCEYVFYVVFGLAICSIVAY